MTRRSIHVRLDESSAHALDLLTRGGQSDSEAVRSALREAAGTRRRRSALRAEATLLAADPADRREAVRVRELMEDLAPDA